MRTVEKRDFIEAVEEKDWDRVKSMWASANYPFCFLDLEKKKAVGYGGVETSAPCCPSLVIDEDPDDTPYPDSYYDFLKSNPLIVEFSLFERCGGHEHPALGGVKKTLTENPGGVYDAFAEACDAWETEGWD